jgi:hypothetical protein
VTDPDFEYDPTEEDVAAIVALLLEEKAKTIQNMPPGSPWVVAARREAVEKWAEPTRLSRLDGNGDR